MKAESENSKKESKGNKEIKNIVIEMDCAFDGFINRIDTAEERISELEKNDNRNFENLSAKRKRTEKENPRAVGQF